MFNKTSLHKVSSKEHIMHRLLNRTLWSGFGPDSSICVWEFLMTLATYNIKQTEKEKKNIFFKRDDNT